MGNILEWGDKKIIYLVDEVANIEATSYDRKRQVVVKRTRKMKLTLDSSMVITTKEILMDTKKDKVSELLGVGMVISHATIYIAKEDEREAEAMKRELENLGHQADYYKDTTQEVIIIRDKFLGEYGRYKLVRDIFMENTISYQEKTLLCSVSHKHMLRWVEWAHMTLAQIEYIKEIQK
jgi:hypothetical protein